MLRARLSRLPLLVIGSLGLLLVTPISAQRSIDIRSLDDPTLLREANQAEPNERLRIGGVELFDGPAATVDVERFHVFAPGARIHVDTGSGIEILDPPSTVHLRGEVVGVDDSLVVLSVDEEEGVRGLIVSEDRVFVVGAEQGQPIQPGVQRKMGIRQVADSWVASSEREWSCSSDLLETSPVSAADLLVVPSHPPAAASTATRGARGRALETYAVDIAVETDYEFRSKFASTSAATNYVGSLFAAIAAIYSRDVDTQVRVSDLYIYEANNDPWTMTSTINALYELRDYWNSYRTGVDRTTAHLMSGKGMGGGVAYVRALCSSSYGYGVTGNISGSYSPSNPTMVWDLTAVAHELGHNFGTGHTHSYTNAGGAADPVDICYDDCLATDAGGNCTQWRHNQRPLVVPPDGGSIMSYCHLHSGGQSNINPYLGRAGYYGSRSERVTSTILSHVQTRTCLPDPQSTTDIFDDGFESGNASSWN